jgi:DNA-binding IscR family transcriptional regulator
MIAEIADEAKIPRKFLEQILLELKKRGILHSVRGKFGGYTLGAHPIRFPSPKSSAPSTGRWRSAPV